MNDVDLVMNLANVVNFIAVLLLMRAVIKDRNKLKGFSVSGTFLTDIVNINNNNIKAYLILFDFNVLFTLVSNVFNNFIIILIYIFV